MGAPTIYVFKDWIASHNREWVWRIGDHFGRGVRGGTPGACVIAALARLGDPDEAVIHISAEKAF